MESYEIIKKLAAELAKAEGRAESAESSIETLKESSEKYFRWWMDDSSALKLANTRIAELESLVAQLRDELSPAGQSEVEK